MWIPVVLTPNEFMSLGLKIGGYKEERATQKGNLLRFKSLYGSLPHVYAKLWEDLITTDVAVASIVTGGGSFRGRTPYNYLIALNFLKCYQTDKSKAGHLDVSENTARKWSWYFTAKIAALKSKKVIWPTHWVTGGENIPTLPLSVDGVHCHREEPKHPTLSKDKKSYSHKFNSAGFNYEIGIAVYENKVVWLNGPFPAGRGDDDIFLNEGLFEKIPEGKKAVVDLGYKGEALLTKVSKGNSHDLDEVRKLKGRARARHESFNGRLKNFRVLSERFRHKDMSKHKICFEAVTVICVYQMENGSPLFDV